MPAAMFFYLVFKKMMKKEKKIFVFIPMSALRAVNVAVCFGRREGGLGTGGVEVQGEEGVCSADVKLLLFGEQLAGSVDLRSGLGFQKGPVLCNVYCNIEFGK